MTADYKRALSVFAAINADQPLLTDMERVFCLHIAKGETDERANELAFPMNCLRSADEIAALRSRPAA